MLQWSLLTDTEELADLLRRSHTRPQVIFKHSTRCSVSEVAKNRLERSPQVAEADFHYLDLIRYRALSNQIAGDLQVYHESPQVLLVNNGECIYDQSHLFIRMEEITEQIPAACKADQ